MRWMNSPVCRVSGMNNPPWIPFSFCIVSATRCFHTSSIHACSGITRSRLTRPLV